MTIQQTVTIPSDRRLHLDLELPADFPVGTAQIELSPIHTERKQNLCPGRYINPAEYTG
jgi:hypothetical protein